MKEEGSDKQWRSQSEPSAGDSTEIGEARRE